MKRDGHEDVKFFYGTEVEHTPAYGKRTLFVVGVQPVEDIAQALKDCEHIFFGANHSYEPENWDPQDYDYDDWSHMIKHFLKQGILCTLDVPYSQLEEIHDWGFDEYNNFIAQLRISIPYIGQYNYNTMVKIDDNDFNATNPGVWTHSLHKLMDRAVFTPWSDYDKDEIL